MCQKLSDFVCVSARRGNHRVWHRQGEASSDHLSAGLPGGEKKKNHLTGNDLPRVIYEPRSRGQHWSESRQKWMSLRAGNSPRNIMRQTENIVGHDARHNRERNRAETLPKHLNEVVKEQIADEEERWSRGDSVQITLSQWKNELLNQTNQSTRGESEFGIKSKFHIKTHL